MASVLILFVLMVILMAIEALGVAISGAVFLDWGFGDAWSAAWDKPFMLLLFAIISLLFKGKSR